MQELLKQVYDNLAMECGYKDWQDFFKENQRQHEAAWHKNDSCICGWKKTKE